MKTSARSICGPRAIASRLPISPSIPSIRSSTPTGLRILLKPRRYSPVVQPIDAKIWRVQTSVMEDGIAKNHNWIRAIDLATLERDGRALFRGEGRQIALFTTPDGIFACNNRCPHEGYPLREATLGQGCVLTCNWHNWKFDLKTGANLDRGEGLRTYPVQLRDGGVWLDMTEAPVEVRRAAVMASLKGAFDDEDYERLARDLARLAELGDPRAALTAAIGWSWQRLEYG